MCFLPAGNDGKKNADSSKISKLRSGNCCTQELRLNTQKLSSFYPELSKNSISCHICGDLEELDLMKKVYRKCYCQLFCLCPPDGDPICSVTLLSRSRNCWDSNRKSLKISSLYIITFYCPRQCSQRPYECKHVIKIAFIVPCDAILLAGTTQLFL